MNVLGHFSSSGPDRSLFPDPWEPRRAECVIGSDGDHVPKPSSVGWAPLILLEGSQVHSFGFFALVGLLGDEFAFDTCRSNAGTQELSPSREPSNPSGCFHSTPPSFAIRFGQPVPKRLNVLSAFRVEDAALWQRYDVKRKESAKAKRVLHVLVVRNLISLALLMPRLSGTHHEPGLVWLCSMQLRSK